MTPTAYVIRQLTVEDRDALAAAFERLSARSRFRRFLGPKSELSARELTYLVDIDHVTHDAVVAVEPLTGRLIGVARYAANGEDDRSADFAVVVADEWQRRGVGTVLSRRAIERAQANGFDHLTGETLWDNDPARKLLSRLGFRTVRTLRGVAELELWLRERPAGSVGPPQWSSVS